jgi:hypothetical protein
MNSKIILQLIKKDLDELQLLVDAMITEDEIDQEIIDIALSKSQTLQNELKLITTSGKPLVSQTLAPATAVIDAKVETEVPLDKTTEQPRNEITVAKIVEAIAEPKIEQQTNKTIAEAIKEEAPATEAILKPIVVPETIEIKATPTLEPQPVALIEPVIQEKIQEAVIAAPMPVEKTVHHHPHHEHDKKILAETFTKEPSLNEKLAASNPHESKIKAKPITNLKNAIGINDRFLFQRELFDNDPGKFEYTVQHIDASGNLTEAIEYLETNYQWNKTETSLKFIELIKRRFQN